MPAERSDRIEELYHAARQREPAERASFLEKACSGDEGLRREIESLLAQDTGVRSFLETPPLEVVRKISGEHASQSMIGRQIGSYSILSLLAKGGMGEVYCARDTKLGRDVALKILPTDFECDPERLARFRREARLLASLNHPHIAAIYGMEESGGTHCLVMELVPGETLAGAGPLPLEKALTICRQIAEGLEEAHRKNITHRDIKPGQHQGDAGRCREDSGFRFGEGVGLGAIGSRSFRIANSERSSDRRRTHSRNAGLHESRAGERQSRRQTDRHLGVWLRSI